MFIISALTVIFQKMIQIQSFFCVQTRKPEIALTKKK